MMFMHESPSLFACPVCQLPLHIAARIYQCANGHHFDMAREGYVNLLLASQKRSHEPGDSAVMIRNRRAFLNAGYYEPLLEQICKILQTNFESDADHDGSILDVGCGEGYYIGSLQARVAAQSLLFGGVDVSKYAIKAAARRYDAVEFAVAGAHHLPLADMRIDFLLNIFAPRAWREFYRILKPDGKLLVVSPGPRHLWQLKKMIYAEPQLHTAQITIPAGFHLYDAVQLNYELSLAEQPVVQQLLLMTPFYWHMAQDQQESLLQLDQLATTVDFQLHIFEKEA